MASYVAYDAQNSGLNFVPKSMIVIVQLRVQFYPKDQNTMYFYFIEATIFFHTSDFYFLIIDIRFDQHPDVGMGKEKQQPSITQSKTYFICIQKWKLST